MFESHKKKTVEKDQENVTEIFSKITYLLFTFFLLCFRTFDKEGKYKANDDFVQT